MIKPNWEWIFQRLEETKIYIDNPDPEYLVPELKYFLLMEEFLTKLKATEIVIPTFIVSVLSWGDEHFEISWMREKILADFDFDKNQIEICWYPKFNSEIIEISDIDKFVKTINKLYSSLEKTNEK